MKKSPFYLYFSIWSALMVILGFWPKYFGQIFSGDLEVQWIIHVHAFIFTGWIVLFFIQAYSIYRSKTKEHIKRGKIGVYYGIIVMITGLLTAFLREEFHLGQGDEEAAIFSLVAGVRDVIVFGILFSIAIYFKNKPQLHRIWMLGAAAYLLVPAVARANGFLFQGNMIMFIILWLLPVFFGIMLDYQRKNPFLWNYVLVLVIMIGSGSSLGFLIEAFK